MCEFAVAVEREDVRGDVGEPESALDDPLGHAEPGPRWSGPASRRDTNLANASTWSIGCMAMRTTALPQDITSDASSPLALDDPALFRQVGFEHPVQS